jgi:superfamily II DNA or RNA helicase
VNKVALRLFEHNEKAYYAAVRMMEQYGKAAIVHPTGTGKSYIAFKLIEDNPEKIVIWLSPSEYIFKTQLDFSCRTGQGTIKFWLMRCFF